MRKALWILALITALGASNAQASTTVISPEGSPFPYQRWIDESQVPTPDVTIEVIGTEPSHACPAREGSPYLGCTSPTEHKIWLDEDDLGSSARSTFYHEIGHNFDADDMTEWARERFDQIYGLGGPWLVIAEPEPMSPGEWFAEAYSQCSIKSYVTHREMWALGRAPIEGSVPILDERVAHNKACRMIQNL